MTASGGLKPMAGCRLTRSCPTAPASWPVFRQRRPAHGSQSKLQCPGLGFGARTLPHRRLRAKLNYSITRDGVFWIRQSRSSPSRRIAAVPGPALHRTHLSRDRHLRAFSPLDRSARHPFLSLLSGFFRLERSEIHGRVDCVDRTVFWSNIVAGVAPARALPALRHQLP